MGQAMRLRRHILAVIFTMCYDLNTEDGLLMALHLILDGYNVIGASHRHGFMQGGEPELAREMLIEDLRRYKRNKGFRITVVFDAQHTTRGRLSRETYKGIHVVFTRGHEKADEVIVRMVRRTASGVVVVSSDREVAERCRQLGATVISAGEFEMRMERALLTEVKGQLGEEDEEDAPLTFSTKKRGSARKLARGGRRHRKRFEKL